MKREIFEFICPVYFLPYIINGDMDNLTAEEIEQINDKLNGYTCFSYDCEPFFSHRNDINNLGADCVILTALKND